MKTKLQRSKSLVIAGLSLALMGTVVGGSVATIEAKAADSAVTVGKFLSYDGYTFNGTSANADENRTVITCVVAGYARSLVYVENVTSASQVSLGLTSDKAVTLQLTVFDNPGVSTQYGTPVNQALTANELFETSFTLGDLTSYDSSATSCVFAFYFDTAATTPSGAKVTVNTLTVDGVSYTRETYDPSKDEVVEAPETSFSEMSSWTVENGTKSESTLTKLTGVDAEGTVDNAAGVITVTNVANPVTMDVPLSQAISKWPNDWTNLYVKVKATGITAIKGYIESADTEDNLFCHNILKYSTLAWNTTDVPSVSEGFTFSTIGLGSYFTNFTGTINKIVLVATVEDGVSAASIEFGGMTFGKTAPKFVNDIGAPELAIGEWVTWSAGLNVANEGTLTVDEDTTYSGLKLSWDKTLSAGASACATISNFNAAKTPKLHIGFYTDSDIQLSIYHGTTCFDGHWQKTYTAGYHSFDIDVSAVSFTPAGNNEEYLYFYVDHGADLSGLDSAKVKTVVFDSILFHDDLEIVLKDAVPGTIYTNVETTATGISWEYDASAAGAYHQVNIPVNNWYSFNHRYLILNVSFSHDMKFGVYFDAAGGGTGGLIAHAEYKKGDYLLCLDTKRLNLEDNSALKLYFYCDVANASEVSITKKVNIKEIRFSDVELLSSPNADVLTIDYANRTVSFDATKYEVSTNQGFTEGTILASGAAVTPGTALYVRAIRGEEVSAATKVELAATPLTAATAPTPAVTENTIRYTAPGYEFKMEGKDNEWKALGSWGGLTAGTEYTIQIRKAATETAFASEAVTVKITTTASSGSTGNTGNTETPGGDEEPEDDGGCNSSITGGLGIGLAVCGLAAGAAVCFLKKRKN